MAQATASAKPAGLPAPAAGAKPQRRPVAHDMTPGCWDKFSMGFMTPVVVAGAHDRLEMEDLRPLRTSDAADINATRFEQLWAQEKASGHDEPRATRIFARLVAGPLLMSVVFGVLAYSVPFAQPIVLEELVGRLQDPNQSITWQAGVLFTSLMVVTPFLESWSMSQMDCLLHRSGVRIQGALGAAVFRKAMRLSPGGRHDVGNVVNLMSVDASSVFGAIPQIHRVWLGPIRVVVALVLLFQAVGVAALAGLGVNVLLMPVYAFLGMRFGRIHAAKMQAHDERVKIMSEIIQGIKIIKCFTWESEFMQRVFGIRKRELEQVYKGVMNETILVSVIIMSPMLSSLATFATYAWLGNELTAARVFTAVALFGMIRVPLMEAPMALSAILEARVSTGRLWRFFQAAECRDMRLVKPPPASSGCAARIVAGDFTWEDEEGTYRDEGRGKDLAKGKGGSDDGGDGSDGSDTSAAPPKPKGGTAPASGAESKADPPQAAAATGRSTLSSINLDVRIGKLTCIVGKVASGKSSLLAAMLGELRQTHGELQIGGMTAFAAQTPWIINATLRKNIIMDKAFDRPWYNKVIKASAMQQDLEALVSHDHTEIGERGLNLSGGQKQRVSVARAVYHREADIFMFDDPLSAVDGHVGRHIFENVFMDLLKDKTRVLVTQQMQYLRYADHVVVMRDGKIWKQGTYEQLVAEGVDFDDLQPVEAASGDELSASDGGDELGDGEGSAASDEGADDETKNPVAGPSDAGVPVETGSVDAGSVVVDTSAGASATTGGRPKSYPRKRGSSTGSHTRSRSRSKHHRRTTSDGSRERSRSGSFSIAERARAETTASVGNAGALTEEEARSLGKVSSSVYMAYIKKLGGVCFFTLVFVLFMLTMGTMIASDVWLGLWTDDPAGNLTFYLGIYFVWAVAHSVATCVKGWVFAKGCVGAAKKMHDNLLLAVMRAPLRYFHTTMSGRILNRFAKDVESVDSEIGAILNTYLTIVLFIIMILITIASILPIFAIILPIFGIMYIQLQRYYRGAALELNRLQDISRSPIFQHFGECIHGVVTLRAFKMMDKADSDLNALMDVKHQAYITLNYCMEWLGIRIGVLGALIVGLTCAALVFAQDTVDPGLAGLAMGYSFQVFGVFGFAVFLATWLEVKMNHVDRVLEYTAVEPEPPEVVQDRIPDAAWPQHGAIRFQNYSLRYREGLPLVLKDITLEIEAGAKVGIVGRTGAGKSSLVSALLRLYDGTGDIVIDGESICTMGLKHVRQAVEIIVQEPVLFIGTVRSNIDTFDKYTDQQVWEALDRVGMGAQLRESELKLQTVVESGGSNFSVGERQLLCMARSMVRNPRVLILDESTASVDVATDAMLQKTVRRVFADATVLAIAHRMNTIMDSDKIIVMDDGRVVEYDSPVNLLRDADSMFSAMVAKADNPEQLRRLALQGSQWGTKPTAAHATATADASGNGAST